MPINAKLFRQIADVIEHHPDNYSQGCWFEMAGQDTCGTENVPTINPDDFKCTARCCIAGWAVALTPVEQRPDVPFLPGAARILLGLSHDDSDLLFSGYFSPVGMSVSDALRKIADTGKMLPYAEFTISPPSP